MGYLDEKNAKGSKEVCFPHVLQGWRSGLISAQLGIREGARDGRDSLNKVGKHLRAQGHEFGTTTGRPRRCGWLDVPMLRYSHRLNGYDSLNLTKLDVMTGLPHIKICTHYRIGGSVCVL